MSPNPDPAAGQPAYRDDAELAAACARGEEAAFIELERRHRELVLRVAYRFLGDKSEALDVAQEVFLAAYRGLGRWRPEGRLASWLYRVTANLAMEHERRRARRRATEAEFGQSPPGRAEPAERAEDLSERIRAALASLPERQRLAVTLRFLEDLSLPEVAEVLDVSPNTAKVALARGMRSLRRQLEA